VDTIRVPSELILTSAGVRSIQTQGQLKTTPVLKKLDYKML